MKTININGYNFIIPDGFKHILWKDVEHNQRVFIVGTSNKQPFPYGPYTVVDKTTRELMNKNETVFNESPESLIIEV